MGESSEAVLKMLEEGESEGRIAQKRIKGEEIMEKDGISALPDCLLLKILSRLPSTKHAIRTGALSKRWEHLWTWVPSLIFSRLDYPKTRRLQNPNSRSDFALLVDKTLTQCRQLKLRKFEVHTLYDIRFEGEYHNWIRHAISRNAEELTFVLWAREPEFLLDQVIFINSCFTDLRLVGCKLIPTGAISWENLRSLFLSWVVVDEDLIVNIVSGSPLLETLMLHNCHDYSQLNNIITTSDSDDESDADIIESSAPTSVSLLTQCQQLKLKKFQLSSAYDIPFQLQLNNWIRYALRCNVKELNLKFWNTLSQYEFMLDQIFFTSSCFTKLTLHGCMLNPVGAISWKNLRSLHIISYQSLDEDLIESILSGSPVLEALVLDNCYGYKRLNITSKSVKNLVLSGYKVPYGEPEDDVIDVIEINAPNIMSLTIEEGIYLGNFLLLNVSSLVKAKLNYSCKKNEHRGTPPKEEEQETLKGYIMNLGHVKELEIGFFCSEAFSCLQAKGFLTPSNVKVTGVTEELNSYMSSCLAI